MLNQMNECIPLSLHMHAEVMLMSKQKMRDVQACKGIECQHVKQGQPHSLPHFSLCFFGGVH
jgi:hypothetical protein